MMHIDKLLRVLSYIERERAYHMARIKLAYIGGGSTRAAGTMASFIQQGQNFDWLRGGAD